MKRISILATSVVALIGTIGMPLSVQAASCGQNQIKVIVAGANNNNCNTQEIKDQLSQYGIQLDEVINNYCNTVPQENCNITDIVTDTDCDTGITDPQTDTDCQPATPTVPEVPVEEIPVGEETPAKEETPVREDPPVESETPSGEERDNPTYQEQVVRLVNEERAKAGLSALAPDEAIQSAAQVRAQESAVSFSHTRPNGTSFSTALTDAGVKYRGSGENIAWGQKTPEEVVEGWMNSPGHRANILNPSFTKIGIGYYQDSRGVNYWSQLFTY